jgi:hypothetical protein
MRKFGYLTNAREPNIYTAANATDSGTMALAGLTQNFGMQSINDGNSLTSKPF